MTVSTRGFALLILCLALTLWVGVGLARAQSGAAGDGWARMGALPASAYSLAVDPAKPSVVYALGTEGISHSTDKGANWSVCNREARGMRLVAPPPWVTGTLTLYSTGPSGLRQSGDGCATWKDVPTQGVAPSNANVRWVATYPNNSAVLYAGMDGLGGLYRSTDGGGTWQGAAKGLPGGAWATALAADTLHPERIFLGLRHTARDHPPVYVYKSTDGGLSWRTASLGLNVIPNNRGEVTGLAWSGDALFAATSSDGLFASTDTGESWHRATMPRRTGAPSLTSISGLPPATPMPLGIQSLAASSEGALVLATDEGAFRSTDGGRSWQSFGPSEAARGRLLVAMEPWSGQVLLATGANLWGYKMPAGVVKLPTQAPPAVAQTEPTPPPPPKPTPAPPTATKQPTATARPTSRPTATEVARPPGWLPSDRAQPMDRAFSDYFPETGHNIAHGFRDYWLNNGGLALLGYPLTEEFVENGVTVQYFERVRLEYHGGKITWGLLGSELTKGKFFQTVRFFPSEDDNVYFGPTQHSASGPFLRFWRANGGLETLGYPLSQSIQDDGSEYQWFERGRLEWHPWLPEGERIQLGLVGKEFLKKRGWVK
ncbi:MAG: hypothetical protein ACJ78Q_02250 [Chloroflexia bacterium]